MSLEERIAKLKTSLLEKHVESCDNESGSFLSRDLITIRSKSFIAGANAVAEIYRLKGKIEAFEEAYEGEYRKHQLGFSSDKLTDQLEALLLQEEKV